MVCVHICILGKLNCYPFLILVSAKIVYYCCNFIALLLRCLALPQCISILTIHPYNEHHPNEYHEHNSQCNKCLNLNLTSCHPNHTCVITTLPSTTSSFRDKPRESLGG